MIEKRVLSDINRIERYLRREDTVLAKSLNHISPLEGAAYRHRQSPKKIIYDKVMSVPFVVFPLPLIPLFAAAIKVEDIFFRPPEERGPVFYRSKRLDENGQIFEIWKLRSLVPGSDQNDNDSDNIRQSPPEKDPRATFVGRIMRALYIDELPQAWQVLFGNKLALVAPRAKTAYAINEVRKEMIDEQKNADPKTRLKSKIEYIIWRIKCAQGRLGLFNLNALINPNPKNDKKAMRPDNFQADHASLAFDLLVVTMTPIRILKRLLKKG